MTNEDIENTGTHPVGCRDLFAPWRAASDAPKDGTQILADFGYPWAQVATWNSHEEKWATASMQAQGMEGDTTDVWFETELESHKELKRWKPIEDRPSLLRAVVGVYDAFTIMGGLPGQTKAEKDIWSTSAQQLLQAIESVVPSWDAYLKADFEQSSRNGANIH